MHDVAQYDLDKRGIVGELSGITFLLDLPKSVGYQGVDKLYLDGRRIHILINPPLNTPVAVERKKNANGRRNDVPNSSRIYAIQEDMVLIFRREAINAKRRRG